MAGAIRVRAPRASPHPRGPARDIVIHRFRTPMRRAPRAPRLALLLAICASAFAVAAAWHQWPVIAAGNGPHEWPRGDITYWDAAGASASVDAAAARWNGSGVAIRFHRATSRANADVVFVADRRTLRSRCGPQCLGLSSSIGRPDSGRVTVTLEPDLTGHPTALSVWVSMHELGHVLGLQHREGTCSLMTPRAYDDACRAAPGAPQGSQLPVCPAAEDVATASRLYGRRSTVDMPCV
jgi:Matrixin